MWSDAVKRYLSQTIDQCRACCAIAPPQPNRKESISSLFQSFNDVVCIDHLYEDSIRVFMQWITAPAILLHKLLMAL